MVGIKLLFVKHNMSSAYDTFHVTLKFLLCVSCIEMKRDWEQALPWVLLAAGVFKKALGLVPMIFVCLEHGIGADKTSCQFSRLGSWLLP